MAKGEDGEKLVMNFVSKFYSRFSPELHEMLQREMKNIGEEQKKKATAKAATAVKDSGEHAAAPSGGRQPGNRVHMKISPPNLSKKRKIKELLSPISADSLQTAIRRPLVGPEFATGKMLLVGRPQNPKARPMVHLRVNQSLSPTGNPSLLWWRRCIPR